MYGYKNGDAMIKKCEICGKEYEDDGYYRQFTIICETPKFPERSHTIKPTLCPECAWKTFTAMELPYYYPDFLDRISNWSNPKFGDVESLHYTFEKENPTNICDFCAKEIANTDERTVIWVGKGLDDDDSEIYEACGKCAEKIKRYIKEVVEG